MVSINRIVDITPNLFDRLITDGVPRYHSSVTSSESNPQPETQVNERLKGVDEIITKHGNFIRVHSQSIFNESEIARNLEEIGYPTNQLMLDYGIFIRESLLDE
ncbi:hypothetical protein JCM10914A_29130 [Paenibacillus sp. JCM 10914]|uniref:hypothetical protein n=1 Tax=Paenibacillus sp. JCM 10914 TaxID=1236974 RepID=UPI000563AB15|nr:hypothetical protein [Paenibacillus sp. JCM 10914]